MRTKKIPLGGEEHEGIELDFTVVREEWNEYDLADGGRVRVKTSVQRILRILDAEGKPARTAEDEPFIVVQSVNQVVSRE
jgi:hypothetical protein